MEHDELIRQVKTRRLAIWRKSLEMKKGIFAEYEYPGVATIVLDKYDMWVDDLEDSELNEWLNDKDGEGVLRECRKNEHTIDRDKAESYLKGIGLPSKLWKCISYLDCMRAKDELEKLYVVQHPQTIENFVKFKEQHLNMQLNELNEAFTQWMSTQSQEQPSTDGDVGDDDYAEFLQKKAVHVADMKKTCREHEFVTYQVYLKSVVNSVGKEKIEESFFGDEEYCAWQKWNKGYYKEVCAQWAKQYTDEEKWLLSAAEMLDEIFGLDRDTSKDEAEIQKAVECYPEASKSKLEKMGAPRHYIECKALELLRDNTRKARKCEGKKHAESVNDAITNLLVLCDTNDLPLDVALFGNNLWYTAQDVDSAIEDLRAEIKRTYGFDIYDAKAVRKYLEDNPDDFADINRAIKVTQSRIETRRKKYTEVVKEQREEKKAKQERKDAKKEERRERTQTQQSNGSSNGTYSTPRSGSGYNFNRRNQQAQNDSIEGIFGTRTGKALFSVLGAAILIILAFASGNWYFALPAIGIVGGAIVSTVYKKPIVGICIAAISIIILCIIAQIASG